MKNIPFKTNHISITLAISLFIISSTAQTMFNPAARLLQKTACQKVTGARFSGTLKTSEPLEIKKILNHEEELNKEWNLILIEWAEANSLFLLKHDQQIRTTALKFVPKNVESSHNAILYLYLKRDRRFLEFYTNLKNKDLLERLDRPIHVEELERKILVTKNWLNGFFRGLFFLPPPK
jgi:hypothetical protein